MKYQSPPASFFRHNRERLISKLADNSVVIIFSADEFPRNGDQFFPFRQNSDFYYLSGIDQETCSLLLFKGKGNSVAKCQLFIKKTDKNQVIWYGHKHSLESARALSGIDEVFWEDAFEKQLSLYAREAEHIYIWQNEYAKFSTPVNYANLRESLRYTDAWPHLQQRRLFPLMQELRMVKQAQELQQIKKAIAITRQAYLRVLKSIKPGQMEYEIEAEITYEFLRNGATGHAYAPIIAGGRNACILHYPDNDKPLKAGELVLMDFGAEYGNYAADCSRTIPVSGRFTERQRACYDAVLEVYKRAHTLYVPGNTIDNINKTVGEWMQEKMLELGLLTPEDLAKHQGETPPYFKYFMHGTSHFMGLDVHDVGSKQTPLQKGMVLSCEPGLYIEEEGIGIRIETDILVEEEPVDLMADFPVEADDIMAIMSRP